MSTDTQPRAAGTMGVSLSLAERKLLERESRARRVSMSSLVGAAIRRVYGGEAEEENT